MQKKYNFFGGRGGEIPPPLHKNIYIVFFGINANICTCQEIQWSLICGIFLEGLYTAFHRSQKLVHFMGHAIQLESMSENGKGQKQQDKGLTLDCLPYICLTDYNSKQQYILRYLFTFSQVTRKCSVQSLLAAEKHFRY